MFCIWKGFTMKRKVKRYRFLFLVSAVLFLFSSYKVCSIMIQERKERQTFEKLEEIVHPSVHFPIKPADDTLQRAEEGSGDASGPDLSSYIALKEENSDFFGWISIEGTDVSYPVMYTPEDEEYYLHRDFYGKEARSGVPFLAASCYEGCGNYLIYGHHMKNGTMFASLLDYAGREYWEEHPVIRFDTLTASGEYEVAAAFYSEAYPQDASGVFRFYQYTDLSEPYVFAEYMEQVRRAALYDTGVNVEYGSGLLTLCTCSYHMENGRFVVVARKK